MKNKNDRGWVLKSTKHSIASRKVSVSAIMEIPCSILFFWWISSISPWPWITLVAVMAAPFLLLRSPRSVRMGITIFKIGANRRITRFGFAMRLAISLVSSVVLAGYVFGWVFNIYPLSSTPVLFGALFCIFVFPLLVFALSPFHRVRLSSPVAPWIIIAAAAGLALGVAQEAGWKFGLSALLGAIVAGVSAGLLLLARQPELMSIIMMPGATIGLFFRLAYIRFIATIANIRDGMSAFSSNWHETAYVVDIFHLPEMLPGIGSVFPILSMSGMIEQFSSRSTPMIVRFFAMPIFILLIYVPAIMYRANIKAGFLFWGCIAWLFNPVLWLDDEDMRSRSAFWTTWFLQSFLLSSLLASVAWLLAPFMSQASASLVPELLRSLTPPPLGARYVMLWLAVISVSGLLFSAYRLRSAHAKALEGAGDYHNGYTGELKDRLKSMAAPVHRWLRGTIFIWIITLWIFSLWWALQRWPHDLQNLIWSWLRPLL